MDYYTDLLINPIENFSIETELKPYPDIYRRYPFDLKNFTLTNDVNIMSEISKTNIKLWQDDAKLLYYFEKMLSKHQYLSSHIFTDLITKKKYCRIKVKQYYKEIYDLADIIIAKASINNDSQIIHVSINLLFPYFNIGKKLQIALRLIYYFSHHYINIKKIINPSVMQTFSKTTVNKLEEFAEHAKIVNIFTKNEIIDYLNLYNSLCSDTTS